jgi:hypothetical protein
VNDGVNRSGILLEMRPNVMIQTPQNKNGHVMAVFILWIQGSVGFLGTERILEIIEVELR